jgi:hypothetical protein
VLKQKRGGTALVPDAPAKQGEPVDLMGNPINQSMAGIKADAALQKNDMHTQASRISRGARSLLLSQVSPLRDAGSQGERSYINPNLEYHN